MLSGTGLVAGYRKGVRVLDGFDLEVPRHTVVGLAGPSGCGKSTAARVLALLQRPWSGTVALDSTVVTRFRLKADPAWRRAIGLVFQHPRTSVDPRFTLWEVVAEPARAYGIDDVRQRVAGVADQVGLTAELLERRPHEVSDGQLQRACLARALVLDPRYLICDEMTAMLDASTTAALVRAVGQRVENNGTGVLAISHDEALLERWASTVIRM